MALALPLLALCKDVAEETAQEDFETFWEQGGPWPALLLSTSIGVSCLVLGVALMKYGAAFTSSPLILCSVVGLLIGLSLLVVLPQVPPRRPAALATGEAERSRRLRRLWSG